MVMKERDEELAMFLEMRRREKQKEMNDDLLSIHSSDEQQLNVPLGSNGNGNGGGGSPVSKIVRKTAAENFLNSENEKSDYDWLLTPPGTPLFPSLEMGSQKILMSQMGKSNARPVALKTRLANLPEEPASRSTLGLKQQAPSAGVNSSGTLNKWPSSSGGPRPASRPATPTGRPALPAATKPSRSSTPTSRANLPSVKPTVSTRRSSTPTSRANMPSVKPAASTARSSTPTRSTARSLTPTARPSLPASKSTSRSSTPTRRPATSSSTLIASGPSGRSSSVTRSAPTTSSVPKSASLTSSLMRSAPATSSVAKSVPAASSITKSAATTSKSSIPSRGASPTMKSRPWKPSEMPGFSLETPPNLRTSLPERPASASRGRPGAPGSRSSSVEPKSNGMPRRQSCSPTRNRPSSGSVGNRSSVRSVRRADANGSDNDSPVVMGTKMVERVVNMRKLVPPRQDDNHRNNPTSKLSTSLDSSGFGRSLSKKSLDMAMRHMDIRRTISGNQRPNMTNVPASSIYSVRSGSTRSRTISVTDSPLDTSSTASSELSVNNNCFFMYGSEMEDNGISSERGISSPTSQRAS